MSYRHICKNPLIVAVVSLLLFASLVKAETIQLEVEPEKLTIAGTNRDKIKRTLVLTSDRPIALDRQTDSNCNQKIQNYQKLKLNGFIWRSQNCIEKPC